MSKLYHLPADPPQPPLALTPQSRKWTLCGRSVKADRVGDGLDGELCSNCKTVKYMHDKRHGSRA
jgi:hypothetical protein